MLPGPVPPLSCFTQYTLSLSSPQKLQGCPVVKHEPGHQVWLGYSLILYYLTNNMPSVLNLMPFFPLFQDLGTIMVGFLVYNTGHKVGNLQMAPVGKLFNN